MTLYVGEGPRGSNGARLTLLRISIFHSATYNQTGPLWCWFPSKWACAHSRPLWVSPTTSPMSLGVSPAAAPTPTGVFNQRFEALFPPSWSPGLHSLLRSPPFVPVYLCANMGLRGATPALPAPFFATLSPALSVYMCVNVGPRGLLVVGLPALFVPHSASSVPPRPRKSSLPLLPVWMNVYFLFPWCRTSLPFDFLSVLGLRGGAVCLPTLPSWFSTSNSFNVCKFLL